MVLRGRRFTLRFLFLLTALIALATRPGSLATVILIESIAVFFCIDILTHNLPTVIHRALRNNCRRGDGTWSARRARIEEKAVQKVGLDMLFAAAAHFVAKQSAAVVCQQRSDSAFGRLRRDGIDSQFGRQVERQPA